MDLGIVDALQFKRIALNAHADDGIKILYTDHCLFSFKLNNLIKNRISGLDAFATRQIEKNYFILSETDKYRI